MYPEGRVNVDKDLLRFKWGVARIIMEAKTPPKILPVYHDGTFSQQLNCGLGA
jgi:monolysocardiolipin acyltransferase